MRRTAKSAIPLTLMRFITAGFAFLIIGKVFSEEVVPRFVPRDRSQFYLSGGARISPDGTLTYTAYRWPERPGSLEQWAFDETLEHKWKVSAGSNEEREEQQVGRGHLRPINPEGSATWGRSVLNMAYTGLGAVDRPLVVWWNGPKGCFDVYERNTRRRVESLGPNGIVAEPAYPSERFAPLYVTGRHEGTPNPAYVATRDAVFGVTIPTMSLTQLHDQQPQAMGTFSFWGRPSLRRRVPGAPGVVMSSHDLALIAGGEFLVIDSEGEVLQRLRLPKGLVDLSSTAPNYYGGIEATLFQNGTGFFTFRQAWGKQTAALVAEDGRIIKRVDVDISDISRRINNTNPRGGAASLSRSASTTAEQSEIRFPTLLSPLPWLMSAPALAQSLALSLLLAGLIFWRQTRIGRRGVKRIAWTIFTFATGLLGAATYFVAYRDYRTEPCPQCNGRRPVAEDICPHCRAPWPSPEPMGMEIVESA